MEELLKISNFVLESFIQIWPYLLVTIPIAALINISGTSAIITRFVGKSPVISVFLATAIGAFSPFCSCGVIPVISSMLVGGVPLAPVMSFWIASPSMDPEIFFLSSSVLGWRIAIWRLASTFFISLLSGYITYFAMKGGFLSGGVLKINMNTDSDKTQGSECTCATHRWKNGFNYRHIITETGKATWMVSKFMILAFTISALLKFYVPQDLFTGMITGSETSQVVLATLIGIPLYTSNITALPVVGGLLNLGMNEGAALSFLIGGSATTIPAMVAVWGIARKRVFVMYVSFAMFGALLTGLLYNIVYNLI